MTQQLYDNTPSPKENTEMKQNTLMVPAYLPVPFAKMRPGAHIPGVGSLDWKVLNYMSPAYADTLDALYLKVAPDCRGGLDVLELAQAMDRLISSGLARTTIMYMNRDAEPALPTKYQVPVPAQKKPESGFYFVWTKPTRDLPRSMQSPKQTYPNIAEAQAAAEELAVKFPAQKFFVVKTVAVMDRAVVITPREMI